MRGYMPSWSRRSVTISGILKWPLSAGYALRGYLASCPPGAVAVALFLKRPLYVFVFYICCLGLTGPAQAERADRGKPINLEADRVSVDDAQKTSVFEGKVVMTQGTLTIRADKVTVRRDPEGHQYGSANGNPATFRQKRDGANEYIDGEAERIEYNGKLDKVEFFNRARLRREPADEVRGNYISYDSRTEFFTVTGGAGPAASGSPDARVHAVIQPRITGEDAEKTPAPGAPKR
jgi:lipopolysaccharide export system protein LptA